MRTARKDPAVISETRQEFEGRRYSRSGQDGYYRLGNKARGSTLLHRNVWAYHYGEIPEKHHIHHIDGDKGNNCIDNLECVPDKYHRQHHHQVRASELSKAWHASEEGRKWHSEHFEKNIRPTMVKNVEKTCTVCGEKYLTFKIRANQSKYCSDRCKARALRKRRADAKRRRVLSSGSE